MSEQTSESRTLTAPDDSGQANDPGHAATVRSGRQRSWRRAFALFLLLAALLALLWIRDDLRRQALATAQVAGERLVYDGLNRSPRQVYEMRLWLAGLDASPLAERWRSAVSRAGRDPGRFRNFYQTAGRFTADTVAARVYQITLGCGQALEWRLQRDAPGKARLYASIERRVGPQNIWTTVTAIEADDDAHQRIIDRGGDYRFVLQPELFGAVNYRIAMAAGGSLDFPVQGATNRDIGSGFGAPRDGGTRAHHGVDIFADRRTPVLAVASGQVRTGTAGIGGNHVWLSGGLFGIGGARYYYAHLDSFAIESGDRVNKGEVLGYVGNTGNARTTPPHLHFGIYTFSGPVDPAPFLKPAPELPGNKNASR